MSTPITADTTIFGAEDFCPGAGLLAVHIPDWKEDMIQRFEYGVKESVPCITSFGRYSPLLKASPTSMPYSYVRAELAKLYEAWEANVRKGDKMPVVSLQFMDKWFERMRLNRAEVLTQLGVAQRGDSIDLCVSLKGGHKLVVRTLERQFGEAFRRRMKDAYKSLARRSVLLEALTDVAILTALAEFNRQLISWQVCDACGFAKVRKREFFLSTLTGGIHYPSWSIIANETGRGDKDVFLMPGEGDRAWEVCQAPKGEEDKTFPWVAPSEVGQTKPITRNMFLRISSMECCPLDKNWCLERS